MQVRHNQIGDGKRINLPPRFFARMAQGHGQRIWAINKHLTSWPLDDGAAAKARGRKYVACSNHQQLHFEIVSKDKSFITAMRGKV